MNRRHFLQQGAALTAVAGIPSMAQALPMLDPFAPLPGPWRTYELTTKIELAGATGPAQVWMPIPAIAQPLWSRPAQSKWKTNATAVALRHDAGSPPFVYAQWAGSAGVPSIEITGRVVTRDRTIDFIKPGIVADLVPADRQRYTAATALIPTDGIVKSTSDTIVSGATSELAKARALYEWTVDKTTWNPQTPGCGAGNVRAMFASGNFAGKSADINALFVALARAAGVPARMLYGIRAGPSAFGYQSIGVTPPNVTSAQHCRAEVFLGGFGWVPADPADVRRIAFEEPPGHLALDNVLVTDARTTLFGAWESNWIAYNDAQDVTLPGSTGPTLGFLTYPQAETAGQRLNPLAPDAFRYTIAAREISS